MPQMAPLSWINLFLSFSLIFVTMSSMNYFSFKYETKKMGKTDNKIKTNWKW